MTDPHNELRSGLTAIAERAAPVDLTDRVHRESKQIGRRRRALVAVAACGALAAGVGIATAGNELFRADQQAADTTPYNLPLGTLSELGFGQGAAAPGALANVTINLPAWPGSSNCPDGNLTIVKGVGVDHTAPTQVEVIVQKAITMDLPSGVQAEVGLFQCGGDVQVVQYPHLTGGGLGAPALVAYNGRGTDVVSILDIAPGPAGGVRVEVGDRGGNEIDTAQRQWRTYQPTADGFKVLTDPKVFQIYPPAAALAVGVDQDGYVAEDGTSVVNVMVGMTNSGTATSAKVFLQLSVPIILEPTGEAGFWQGCFQDRSLAEQESQLLIQCEFDAMEEGLTRLRTYPFRITGQPGSGALSVAAILVQRSPRTLERDLADNVVETTVIP